MFRRLNFTVCRGTLSYPSSRITRGACSSAVAVRTQSSSSRRKCFARYALELASLDRGFGPGRKDLVKSLRLALDHMSVAARTDDLDALVASDTLFHEVLMDVSGRRR